jgi:hypothetical protein
LVVDREEVLASFHAAVLQRLWSGSDLTLRKCSTALFAQSMSVRPPEVRWFMLALVSSTNTTLMEFMGLTPLR